MNCSIALSAKNGNPDKLIKVILKELVGSVLLVEERNIQNKRCRSVSLKMRFAVFLRDKFTCQYSGKNSQKCQIEVDHILPISKGNSNSFGNLVTACQECNLYKSNTVIDLTKSNKNNL